MVLCCVKMYSLVKSTNNKLYIVDSASIISKGKRTVIFTRYGKTETGFLLGKHDVRSVLVQKKEEFTKTGEETPKSEQTEPQNRSALFEVLQKPGVSTNLPKHNESKFTSSKISYLLRRPSQFSASVETASPTTSTKMSSNEMYSSTPNDAPKHSCETASYNEILDSHCNEQLEPQNSSEIFKVPHKSNIYTSLSKNDASVLTSISKNITSIAETTSSVILPENAIDTNLNVDLDVPRMKKKQTKHHRNTPYLLRRFSQLSATVETAYPTTSTRMSSNVMCSSTPKSAPQHLFKSRCQTSGIFHMPQKTDMSSSLSKKHDSIMTSSEISKNMISITETTIDPKPNIDICVPKMKEKAANQPCDSLYIPRQTSQFSTIVETAFPTTSTKMSSDAMCSSTPNSASKHSCEISRYNEILDSHCTEQLKPQNSSEIFEVPQKSIIFTSLSKYGASILTSKEIAKNLTSIADTTSPEILPENTIDSNLNVDLVVARMKKKQTKHHRNTPYLLRRPSQHSATVETAYLTASTKMSSNVMCSSTPKSDPQHLCDSRQTSGIYHVRQNPGVSTSLSEDDDSIMNSSEISKNMISIAETTIDLKPNVDTCVPETKEKAANHLCDSLYLPRRSSQFSTTVQTEFSTTSTTISSNVMCSSTPNSAPKYSCETPRYNEIVDSHCKEQLDLQNPSEIFQVPQKSIISTALAKNDASILTSSEISKNMTSIAETTPSEFLPEQSIDSTPNVDVSIINDNINLKKLSVPHTKEKTKKHFCLFCKTLQTKFARHIFLKHKNDNKVHLASKMPKKSVERIKIIDELRKKGDFLYNTRSEYNGGILITRRNQQKNFKNKAYDYVCCKDCKGFYSKKSIRVHRRICGGVTKTKSTNIESRKLTQYCHPEANDIMKTQVLPKLNDDKIRRALVHDELIIKYGNKLADKYTDVYTDSHNFDMVRAHLRLLARFKIAMKKHDRGIKELKDVFKPQLHDKCIDALRDVSSWDQALGWYKHPQTAISLSAVLKKCAFKLRTEYIKIQSEEKKKEVEDFILLWEEEVPTVVHKRALEDQTNMKRDKNVVLPKKDDINKLYKFLLGKIKKSVTSLQKKFSLKYWASLTQSSLTLIQVFNRRRAGEIEKLKISNYTKRESVTHNMEKELLKTNSIESVEHAQKFVRIEMRGKLSRGVPILLDSIMMNAVDTLLKYRSKAGLTEDNKYVFANPTAGPTSKKYYRACELLKKFAEECGAEEPNTLRGTTLRKHFATYVSVINAEDAEVDKVANFMGHHKDIHKSHYRQTVPAAEIYCVSKILTAAIGEEAEVEIPEKTNRTELINQNMGVGNDVSSGKRIEKKNDNDGMQDASEENVSKNEYTDDSFGSQKKRRSTSPYGKTTRRRWSAAEKDAIFSEFGDVMLLTKLPRTRECLRAVRKHEALKGRTPQQVKAWINNTIQSKKDKN
ncbi:uncharacterized protein LOC142228235 [Haematobia irritans]|uniref:uncharacterized protein LOC142228235 n=1 Tax=Haematobia irritans TaxID=7368 RepID=UPI003F50756F